MAITLILHIADEDAVVGETEELPGGVDQMVKLNNPRRLDGKDLPYLAAGVVEVYWPMSRLNFIEVMPTEDEEIIGFVRE